MTRKEELITRAKFVARIFEMRQDLTPGVPLHPEYVAAVVADAFADVEREVWSRVLNKLEEDLDIGTFTMIDWCKKQQEGL